MKLLTKEQEQEHYNQTLKGGAIGGTIGLAVGTAGVLLAQRRYHFFRTLTLPLKAFLITSAGTFAGIINADTYSRAYESSTNPIDVEYKERQSEREQAEKANKTFTERAMDFGRKERYKIVGGSWIASMAAAFALVNRNKFLTGQQKIVQARVYAQFLTLGVLVATAAFEISDSRNEKGRYETVRYIDPKDPEHKRMLEKTVEREAGSQGGSGSASDDMWKDMVAAEEQRMKEREEKHKEYAREHQKKQPKKNGKQSKDEGDDKKDDKKDEKKDDKKDDKKGDKKDDKQDDQKEAGKEEKKDKK
ncbi:Replication factor C, subunit RFC4 [Exophiala xenobiotica]|nr:Replication factor C, subunit RFC4 [Exophiala xenobiotica]